MIASVLLALFVAAVVGVFLCVGGWQWAGSQLLALFPKQPLQKGDKAHIYLNGRYNRTATLTGVEVAGVRIYGGRVLLPVDYRGGFYAIGTDRNDGSRLVYLACRRYYRLVKAAEFVRKVFVAYDDDCNLTPDCSEHEDVLAAKDEEKEDGDEV